MRKTISITLDDDVLQALDMMTKTLNITRSAFLQYALQLALQRQQTKELEEQHRQGYLTHPVSADEFCDWEDEQEWGNA